MLLSFFARNVRLCVFCEGFGIVGYKRPAASPFGPVLVPKQGRRSRYSYFVLLCVTRVNDQTEDVQDSLDSEPVARSGGVHVVVRNVAMVRNMRVHCAVC